MSFNLWIINDFNLKAVLKSNAKIGIKEKRHKRLIL